MNSSSCCEEQTSKTGCSNRGSGLVLVVVLYILLAIILGSFKSC